MKKEWLNVERYRIQVMELWPDGAKKEAGLAAARITLDSLTQTMPEESSLRARLAPARARQ